MILASIITLALQAADPVAGVWRGSSICQVRPSACNDEAAVYHASRDASGGGYTFEMNKLVAGKEEAMANLDFKFDARASTLTAVSYDRAHRPATWNFTLHGDRMSGRLTAQDGTLLRLIELSRAP